MSLGWIERLFLIRLLKESGANLVLGMPSEFVRCDWWISNSTIFFLLLSLHCATRWMCTRFSIDAKGLILFIKKRGKNSGEEAGKELFRRYWITRLNKEKIDPFTCPLILLLSLPVWLRDLFCFCASFSLLFDGWSCLTCAAEVLWKCCENYLPRVPREKREREEPLIDHTLPLDFGIYTGVFTRDRQSQPGRAILAYETCKYRRVIGQQYTRGIRELESPRCRRPRHSEFFDGMYSVTTSSKLLLNSVWGARRGAADVKMRASFDWSWDLSKYHRTIHHRPWNWIFLIIVIDGTHGRNFYTWKKENNNINV